MKKNLILIAFLLGTSSAFAQVLSSTPFTSGNLLVTRFDVTNTTAAQKINFVEINKSNGTVVQNFNLPSTNTNGAIPLTTVGTLSTDCQLTLSENGQYVTFVGYNQNEGGTTSNTTNSIGRVVGRLSSNTYYKAFQLPDSSTTQIQTGSSDPYNGSNIRSAYSLDGNQFYLAGGSTTSSTSVQGGIWYFTDWNQNNPVQIHKTPNTRAVRSKNNVLYFGGQNITAVAGSDPGLLVGLYKLNTTMPVTSTVPDNDTVKVLTPRSTNFVSFFFTPDGQTLYILNQGTGATTKGVEKWQLVSGTWTWRYSLFSATATPRSFVIDFNNNPNNADIYVLFATTIEKWTDVIANTVNPSPVTATTIYTETTANTALRGITFTPTSSAITMPIKLGNLNAMKTNAGIVLGWNVTDESNEVNQYEIQRSTDGIAFQSLSIIKAKHNGTSLTQYNFTDNSLSASKLYYRVVLHYADSKKTFSNIVTITNKKEDNITVINPAKDCITIGFKENFSGSIEVISPLGNKILSTQIKQQIGWYNMPLPVLPTGMYVVRINDNASQTSTTKQVYIAQ
jgi:hypothetical protein